MGVWVFTVNKWDQGFKRGLKDDFPYIFRSQIFKIQCWWIVYIYMKNDRYFNHMHIRWIDSLFCQKRSQDAKIFYLGFLLQILTINKTEPDGRGSSLSLYNIYTRHLSEVWHLRWLPSSVNRSACKYETPSWMLISLYLLILCQVLLKQFSRGKL